MPGYCHDIALRRTSGMNRAFGLQSRSQRALLAPPAGVRGNVGTFSGGIAPGVAQPPATVWNVSGVHSWVFNSGRRFRDYASGLFEMGSPAAPPLCSAIPQNRATLAKFFARMPNAIWPSSILYFPSSLVAAPPLCASAVYQRFTAEARRGWKAATNAQFFYKRLTPG